MSRTILLKYANRQPSQTKPGKQRNTILCITIILFCLFCFYSFFYNSPHSSNTDFNLNHIKLEVDLNSDQQVSDILDKVASNLMSYYENGSTYKGSITPNTNPDASGFQWYEGGIMWGAMMEYIRISGNQRYTNIISAALVAASDGPVSSFLGAIPTLSEVLEGKWNDDILWWALATVVGGEVYGKDSKMPGGTTFLNVSNTTFWQVMSQWDSNTCNGGIYWSRDRNNEISKGYKSTITHAQQMILGARLSLLTGSQIYIDECARIYQWLKQSGIITSDYRVLDGVDAQQSCAVSKQELSYKVGFTIGALAWMFKTTGNTEYIKEANLLAGAGLKKFTKNDVIFDACEPNCQENQVSPKGVMIRGLGFLHEFTNDNQVKSNVKKVLFESMTAMLKTCDESFNCGNYWDQGNLTNSNVHYQINALELVTAYYKTLKSGELTKKLPAPTTGPVNVDPGSAASLTYFWASLLSFCFWLLL